MTLPLRTLESLRRIDRDRAKAIVKCVDEVCGEAAEPPAAPVRNGIELINAFAGFSLIVAPPCPSLQGLAGLELAEIAPGRFLLVTTGDYSPEALELELRDLMEKLPPEKERERAVLDELRQVLTCHRRRAGITGGNILLVENDG